MRSTATLAVSLLMVIVISDDVTRPTEEQTLTTTNNTTASSYLTISVENTQIVAEESTTSLQSPDRDNTTGLATTFPQSEGRDITTGLEASLVIWNT